MRRLYAWLAGVVGGAAVYKAFRRRPATVAEPDARADELRAKLAEAREAGDDRESFEAGETPGDQAHVAPRAGGPPPPPGTRPEPAPPPRRQRAGERACPGAPP